MSTPNSFLKIKLLKSVTFLKTRLVNLLRKHQPNVTITIFMKPTPYLVQESTGPIGDAVSKCVSSKMMMKLSLKMTQSEFACDRSPYESWPTAPQEISSMKLPLDLSYRVALPTRLTSSLCRHYHTPTEMKPSVAVTVEKISSIFHVSKVTFNSLPKPMLSIL